MRNQSSYSAEVRQYLILDGHTLEVGQCAGNNCFLRRSINHPPAHAVLVTVIDGTERRKSVYLDRGLSADSLDVSFSDPVPR